MEYIKHFGDRSLEYRQFRPTYPNALYQYLISLNPCHQLAWDCGTGSGQAAAALAEHFDNVIATDINQAQLDVAIKKNNIIYQCCPAEKTEIPDTSVDLITTAQALHWFNFDKFYQEIIRVAKPDCVIAAWCYSLGKINIKFDAIITKLYEEILGDKYWPKERKHIDMKFQTIPFPFKKIKAPHFFIEKQLDFSQLIGYLNTWSAVKEYQKINPQNPIDFVYLDLQKIWGDNTNQYVIRWPIHLLAGYVLKD